MSKKARNYEQYYVLNVGHTLKVKEESGEVQIPMTLVSKSKKGHIYVCELPEDMKLDGEKYPKGTIIVWNTFGNNYDIITDPKYDNKYFNSDTFKSWKGPDIFNFRRTQQDLRDINAEDFAKYSKLLKGENNQIWLTKRVSQAAQAVSNTLNNISDASRSNDALTAEYDSSSPTDSTTTNLTTSTSPTSTRSFDFLDDILGTQKEGSKDKTTELDPNQIANTIVNETKLNDTAISSLVSTYLNSLNRINRSYNTQTK